MNSFFIRMLIAISSVFFFAGTASAGCLSREVKDADGSVKVMQVLTDDSETADLQSKGFKASTCSSDPVARRQYRDEMCRLAAFGNEAVQIQLARSIGEFPAKLCASAKQVVGDFRSDVLNGSTSEPTSVEPVGAPSDADSTATSK